MSTPSTHQFIALYRGLFRAINTFCDIPRIRTYALDHLRSDFRGMTYFGASDPPSDIPPEDLPSVLFEYGVKQLDQINDMAEKYATLYLGAKILQPEAIDANDKQIWYEENSKLYADHLSKLSKDPDFPFPKKAKLPESLLS